MRRVVVPAGLIVILTAAYAGMAAYNRTGAPTSTLVLTERELALPWVTVDTGDHPGVRLRVVVDDRPEPLDAQNWLTMERLSALGFDVTLPAGAPEAARYYRRSLPRPAWVVFEYDGPAWQVRARRRAVSAPAYDRSTWSRLVPVDAGPERDVLAVRYGDGRHLVLAGVIGLGFLSPADGGPLVYGRLESLVPPNVRVPNGIAQVLEGLTLPRPERPDTAVADTPPVPRYEVDLAVGRLGLPYIRDVRRLH